MYSLNEKRFVRDLEELLRTQNKLNIAIVGNISAGKSLFEDIFCQRLGDNVECLSRTAEERTGMVREVDNYERNIMWLIKMMNSVTANSVLPQEKITRISKQTLDSIYLGLAICDFENFQITNDDFEHIQMLFESYKKIDMNPVNLIVWIDTDPRRCFMNHAAKAFTKCLPIEDEIEFHIQDIDYKFRQWMNETDDVMVVKIDGNEFELQFEQDARKFAQIVADLVEQRDETLAICEEVHKIHIQ